MNGTVSRRVFVGSVAAGLPLVVGTAGHTLALSSTGQPHVHRGEGTTDAVFEHAVRQLAAIVNKVRRTDATAEDARLAGVHFSTLAVYARQAGIDTHTKNALRDLVRSKGRDAVLTLEIDRARVMGQLKAYGVDPDERWLAAQQPDRWTRANALDALSRNGVTGMFAGIAATFERVAAEFDRRGTNVSRIALVQADDSWRAGVCAELWSQLNVQSAYAAMLCAVMIYMPGMESQCASAQMAALFFLTLYYTLCF
jgi:hypothetical protein